MCKHSLEHVLYKAVCDSSVCYCCTVAGSFCWPLQIDTDACKDATGAVLLKQYDNGLQLIAYHSRGLHGLRNSISVISEWKRKQNSVK